MLTCWPVFYILMCACARVCLYLEALMLLSEYYQNIFIPVFLKLIINFLIRFELIPLIFGVIFERCKLNFKLKSIYPQHITDRPPLVVGCDINRYVACILYIISLEQISSHTVLHSDVMDPFMGPGASPAERLL